MPFVVHSWVLLPPWLVQRGSHRLWRCRVPLRTGLGGAGAVCRWLLHYPRRRAACQPRGGGGVSTGPLLHRYGAWGVQDAVPSLVALTSNVTRDSRLPSGNGLRLPCPAGRFGSEEGLATAECSGVCKAGRWGGEGETTEECAGACASGHYCPSASTSRFQVRCPEGTWADEGATSEACHGLCKPGYLCPSGYVVLAMGWDGMGWGRSGRLRGHVRWLLTLWTPVFAPPPATALSGPPSPSAEAYRCFAPPAAARRSLLALATSRRRSQRRSRCAPANKCAAWATFALVRRRARLRALRVPAT